MMDMDTIRSSAAKTAYDYRVQAAADRSQAAANLYGANQIKASKRTSVAASVVGTAGAVADKWLEGNKVGMWKNVIPSFGA
jgi:hypothetical protein